MDTGPNLTIRKEVIPLKGPQIQFVASYECSSAPAAPHPEIFQMPTPAVESLLQDTEMSQRQVVGKFVRDYALAAPIAKAVLKIKQALPGVKLYFDLQADEESGDPKLYVVASVEGQWRVLRDVYVELIGEFRAEKRMHVLQVLGFTIES